MGCALRILDDDGYEVDLDPSEADALLGSTGGLEGATVSACPRCRSRVLASVALVDLISASPHLPRQEEIVDLADDAPTLHLFVVDEETTCPHATWRDPLFAEWADVVGYPGLQPRH